jgi:hypothetical protein
MIKKSIPWFVWYSLLLIVIIIGTYVGIHIFFSEPFTDPVFSSITPLQNLLQQKENTSSLNTQSQSEPRPTLPPLQVTEKNKYFVNRFDDDPQNPVYIVRGITVGTLIEVNNTIQGTCVLSSDPEHIRYTFILRAERTGPTYTVGIHNGGFGIYANTLESHSLNELKSMIPTGTFIQLRIGTRDYNLDERNRLVAVVEGTKEATQSSTIKPYLRAFSIEIIR